MIYCEDYLKEVLGNKLYDFLGIDSIERSALAQLYNHILRFSKEEGSYTIRAWFVGRKTYLGDNTPAEMFRDGYIDEVLKEIDRYIKSGE